MRYEITILGVVQGVGYRPFVAALAEQLHIKGSVRNSGGVVRIDAFGDAEAMDNFICRLRSYAPPAARVDRVQAERAEKEEQLDTRALVELLQKDVEIMREEEVESLSRHFRSKIEEARKISGDMGSVQSFHATMREVLDYRKWFEFQLECQKTGEKKKELTDRVFFTFSGGEKAMAMYVPLFSAVVAKYAGARPDAPKLISLDEAFAGVDETNIRDMFRLMVEFEFNFMINSQILWGDYDTVPGLAIYQLIRPENAKFVSVIRYIWNGKVKAMLTGEES